MIIPEGEHTLSVKDFRLVGELRDFLLNLQVFLLKALPEQAISWKKKKKIKEKLK